MKRALLGSASVIFLFVFVTTAQGEKQKFKTLSSDYMTREEQKVKTSVSLPAQPTQTQTTPKTPSAQRSEKKSTVWKGSAAAGAVSAQQSVNAPSLPMVKSYHPLPDLFKSPSDLRKPKITVPDYGREYREMFLAAEAKENIEKKSLLNKILDEIVEYGVFIVFGLVIITVFFTLRSEKVKEKKLLSELAKSPEEAKKDIWHEDF